MADNISPRLNAQVRYLMQQENYNKNVEVLKLRKSFHISVILELKKPLAASFLIRRGRSLKPLLPVLVRFEQKSVKISGPNQRNHKLNSDAKNKSALILLF